MHGMTAQRIEQLAQHGPSAANFGIRGDVDRNTSQRLRGDVKGMGSTPPRTTRAPDASTHLLYWRGVNTIKT